MFGKLLRLALQNPSLTIKLAQPHRVKKALSMLWHDRNSLGHIFDWYQDLYGAGTSQAQSDQFVTEACAMTSKADVLVFPVIDWSYRHQRPQHLSLAMAERGYRVFYFSTVPMLAGDERSYRIIRRVAPSVFVCQLRAVQDKIDDMYRHAMDERVRDAYRDSLQALMRDVGLQSTISILHHPYWTPLVQSLGKTRIIYDCMDDHRAFHETSDPSMSQTEQSLILTADEVVTSSAYLHDRVGSIRPNTLIRNGCEFRLFSQTLEAPNGHESVAGYVGAISRWFDIQLIMLVAQLLPTWRFVLVGSTVGCDVQQAFGLRNIEFVGEVDYYRVPEYLSKFDVCMIPFKLTLLTMATNPVKVYEYLAAGKPVVATRLPELLLLPEQVRVASDAQEFAAQLCEARQTARDYVAIERRRAWAREQDWEARADVFESVMRGEVRSQ
ncbi:glycosyl transferase [Nitrospira sp.]|nr:glycosyl transferase [Nitrospira sp.]